MQDTLHAVQWVVAIVFVVGLIVSLVVINALSSKQRRQAVARGWRGRVLSIDFSMGLPGGGPYDPRLNPTESYVWVKYQSEDGAQDSFYVGEYSGAGHLSPGYVDSGCLSYQEVVQHWKPGDLVEKQPGEPLPHRVAS